MTIGEPQNANSASSEALQGVVDAIQNLKASIGTDNMPSLAIDTDNVRPIDDLDRDYLAYAAARWDS